MAVPAHVIAAARATRIERVIEERGIKLKHVGVERVGPCPVCGGTDRFAINTRKQVWNCRICQRGGDAVALVQHLDGGNFHDAIASLTGHRAHAAPKRTITPSTSPPPKQAAEDYEAQQHRKATRLWQRRQPITGSIAETYLREARGYRGAIPPTLAFLPPAGDQHPAMIAAFGLCDEPEPGVIAAPDDVDAIHLTLLAADGSGKADVKPNKIIIARPLGRPIVIAPPNDLLGLAICEGIEDALTAHAALGIGAWAAGAAGFMPSLADQVPDYIESITIFAHDDQGRTGAVALAQALKDRGIAEVLIEGLT